ncbi:MAG: hypothetical protein ACJ8CR_35075 [Roseiflexaceae bacterium]
MDRQARAQLLLDQEEAQQEVARSRSELSKAADVILALGQKLKSRPEEVVFSNAPDSLGDVTSEYFHLLRVGSLDWNDIPDKRRVAELVQELRAKTSQLSRIQGQLN